MVVPDRDIWIKTFHLSTLSQAGEVKSRREKSKEIDWNGFSSRGTKCRIDEVKLVSGLSFSSR